MERMSKMIPQTRSLMLIALALLVSAFGCSLHKPVVKQYQKDGIHFSYFSNWTIVKDAAVAGKPDVRAIHIEGPNNAVVSLICVPILSEQTLEDFAAAVAENRGAAIEGKLSVGPLKTAAVSKGTSAPTTGRIGGKEQQGILQRFSVNLLGTEVPHEARFYALRGQRLKIWIMSQVATDKEAGTRGASELILDSLAIESEP
jgi:hypothetical protein